MSDERENLRDNPRSVVALQDEVERLTNKTTDLRADLHRIRGERDHAKKLAEKAVAAEVARLRARVQELEELAANLLDACDRAEPNQHSPWCNGVHEQGHCEGEFLMDRFLRDARALASPSETRPEPKARPHCDDCYADPGEPHHPKCAYAAPSETRPAGCDLCDGHGLRRMDGSARRCPTCGSLPDFPAPSETREPEGGK